MINYNELTLDFDEDRLPPGQQPIITNSIEQFYLSIDMIVRARELTGYSTMAVVTGLAGVGKTIAIQSYLNKLQDCLHTGLPAAMVLKVMPELTTKQLVATLLRGFGERPRSHTNRHMIANEVAEAILDYDLKILFADEADLLDVKGFEFIRYIYNKTGCPIVVVGLRQILHVIRKYEKFEGRIGPHLEFLPPDENEVLNKILPQLIFPRWQFDPSSAADIKMGMELWERTQPSFRNLRKVLQYASVLAEIHEKERISHALLKQSCQMMLGLKHAEEEPEEEEEEPQTEYERESARRQDARAKKHEASA